MDTRRSQDEKQTGKLKENLRIVREEIKASLATDAHKLEASEKFSVFVLKDKKERERTAIYGNRENIYKVAFLDLNLPLLAIQNIYEEINKINTELAAANSQNKKISDFTGMLFYPALLNVQELKDLSFLTDKNNILIETIDKIPKLLNEEVLTNAHALLLKELFIWLEGLQLHFALNIRRQELLNESTKSSMQSLIPYKITNGTINVMSGMLKVIEKAVDMNPKESLLIIRAVLEDMLKIAKNNKDESAERSIAFCIKIFTNSNEMEYRTSNEKIEYVTKNKVTMLSELDEMIEKLGSFEKNDKRQLYVSLLAWLQILLAAYNIYGRTKVDGLLSGPFFQRKTGIGVMDIFKKFEEAAFTIDRVLLLKDQMIEINKNNKQPTEEVIVSANPNLEPSPLEESWPSVEIVATQEDNSIKTTLPILFDFNEKRFWELIESENEARAEIVSLNAALNMLEKAKWPNDFCQRLNQHLTYLNIETTRVFKAYEDIHYIACNPVVKFVTLGFIQTKHQDVKEKTEMEINNLNKKFKELAMLYIWTCAYLKLDKSSNHLKPEAEELLRMARKQILKEKPTSKNELD